MTRTNRFAHEEICSALQDTGHHAPGWRLLLLMPGILALYEDEESEMTAEGAKLYHGYWNC